MSELGKITAFVLTSDSPYHLLVFEHPTAGLQLPAGTIERGEAPIAAARREVLEETGIGVASDGLVLREQVTELGPNRAVLLETVDSHDEIFRRGHQVKILASDKPGEMVKIREEVLDYDISPPAVLSYTDGAVPAEALAFRTRRTFVLFIEQMRRADPWIQHADGHDFEVRWTRLRQNIPLVEGLKNQREWLEANFDKLQAHL